MYLEQSHVEDGVADQLSQAMEGGETSSPHLEQEGRVEKRKEEAQQYTHVTLNLHAHMHCISYFVDLGTKPLQSFSLGRIVLLSQTKRIYWRIVLQQ